MRNEKICKLAHIYGRIAKIPAQCSHGLVNSAMGQIYHVLQNVFLVISIIIIIIIIIEY